MGYRIAAVAALAAATAVLTACTVQLEPSHDEPARAENAPEFTGPQSSEYADAWRAAASDFVRDVIRDETITDEEWAEVTTRIDSCLARYGIEFLGFEPEGGYGVDAVGMDGDIVQERLAECEKESGEHPIGYLRTQGRINPEGRDLDELIWECLVRERVVPDGYTFDEFTADYREMDIPFLDPDAGRQAFQTCNSDPLDLIDAR